MQLLEWQQTLYMCTYVFMHVHVHVQTYMCVLDKSQHFCCPLALAPIQSQLYTSIFLKLKYTWINDSRNFIHTDSYVFGSVYATIFFFFLHPVVALGDTQVTAVEWQRHKPNNKTWHSHLVISCDSDSNTYLHHCARWGKPLQGTRAVCRQALVSWLALEVLLGLKSSWSCYSYS